MMAAEGPRKCFVISPIGDEDSPIRKHMDTVLDFVIKPALDACGVEAVRADQMNDPGAISPQMFDAIFDYDLCIAVLTFANANVYYELGVAQLANRPVITLIHRSEQPLFDVKDLRMIRYDFDAPSYVARTHISALERFVRTVAARGWQGSDILSPYRRRLAEADLPDAKALGVKIHFPSSKDVVDIVDVEGSFEHFPPAGYEFRGLRYYPHQDGFVPHGTLVIDPAQRSLRIFQFDIGGEPRDPRGIEIAIAGPNARILLDYWTAAHSVHSTAMNTLRTHAGDYAGSKWLPPITSRPRDLVKCDRVRVTRK
jgi:hypothetical protein